MKSQSIKISNIRPRVSRNSYSTKLLLTLNIDLAGHICSPGGLFLANSYVTPALLRSSLKSYLRLDNLTLNSLFDPKDHQNVPKAVRLLMSIYQLSELPQYQSVKEHSTLIFLGQIIGLFIWPYIFPSMSLSQQLSLLGTFAHLMFFAWRMNGSSFFPELFYCHLLRIYILM